MKYRIIICFLIILSMFLLCPLTRAEETHAEAIISEIINTRQAILTKARKSSNEFIFLAFWDFDGTILKGDCSEGMKRNGQWVYKGLAQLAIEAGHSEIYPPKGGADRFWKDYFYLGDNIGWWLALPFIPQMLRGARLSAVHQLSEEYFKKVLCNYYFSSSLRMLKALEDNGINCYIISASADVFVEAAASTLGLNPERFHGIEVRIKEGRLTEEIIYPVTWATGKKEKLISIVKEIGRQHPKKQVIVLVAFGNSYRTDGPFLKYVATQSLPAGKPVAVMINGGEAPPAYQGLFIQVKQSEIQSDSPSSHLENPYY